MVILCVFDPDNIVQYNCFKGTHKKKMYPVNQTLKDSLEIRIKEPPNSN